MRWSNVAVLAPSFYISRPLGLTPLVVKRHRDGSLEFATHKTLLKISLLTTIVMACMSVYATATYMPKILKDNPKYAPYASCSVLSCYASAVLLSNGYFHHKLVVRAFNEVDELSRQLTGHLGYNRLPFEAFFLPTTVALTIIKYYLQATWVKTMLNLTVYHCSYLIQLGSESLFTGFLFHLETLFKRLNTEISEVGLNLSSPITEEEKWLILRRLRHLRKMHNRICDVCDVICKRFSLDLFISIGTMVFILLSTLYAGVWVRTVTSQRLLKSVNMVHYGFVMMRLAHICYRSDYVIMQSEATNAKVQSLMTTYLPAEIKQEIYHFTLQTMLRKVEITACGFYGLRMETITTLAYLVTTSLVMVINLSAVI